MLRVMIIHGWGASPESNWFPWLAAELRSHGVEVAVPEMPNTDNPVQDEWVAKMCEVIGAPNEETFFVGHSLGGIAILRYLESLKEGEKVGGAVIVAGFAEPVGISEIENFFTRPIDFEKIRASTMKGFTVLRSDNDPYIPFRLGDDLAQKLCATCLVIPGGAHLNAGSGHLRFPEVVENLLIMVGGDVENSTPEYSSYSGVV